MEKILRSPDAENFSATNLEVITRWLVPMAAKETIDIHTVYKILRFVAERKEVNVTQIVENVHISYSSANKYLVFLEDRGLVKVETRGRKKIIRITDKGYDLLILISRVYGVLNLKID